jgi:hypothetical protein
MDQPVRWDRAQLHITNGRVIPSKFKKRIREAFTYRSASNGPTSALGWSTGQPIPKPLANLAHIESRLQNFATAYSLQLDGRTVMTH